MEKSLQELEFLDLRDATTEEQAFIHGLLFPDQQKYAADVLGEEEYVVTTQGAEDGSVSDEATVTEDGSEALSPTFSDQHLPEANQIPVMGPYIQHQSVMAAPQSPMYHGPPSTVAQNTMYHIPHQMMAPLGASVYVNNVTANVNVHGMAVAPGYIMPSPHSPYFTEMPIPPQPETVPQSPSSMESERGRHHTKSGGRKGRRVHYSSSRNSHMSGQERHAENGTAPPGFIPQAYINNMMAVQHQAPASNYPTNYQHYTVASAAAATGAPIYMQAGAYQPYFPPPMCTNYSLPGSIPQAYPTAAPVLASTIAPTISQADTQTYQQGSLSETKATFATDTEICFINDSYINAEVEQVSEQVSEVKVKPGGEWTGSQVKGDVEDEEVEVVASACEVLASSSDMREESPSILEHVPSPITTSPTVSAPFCESESSDFPAIAEPVAGQPSLTSDDVRTNVTSLSGAWATPKAWSNLFKTAEESPKPVAHISPFQPTTNCSIESEELSSAKQIPGDHHYAARLGEVLSCQSLDHRTVLVEPRGLTNKANWCYINATLQALLACPPFYNLMKCLPSVAGLTDVNSRSPIIESMVEFVHEFTEMKEAASRPAKKDKKDHKDEVQCGKAFEPVYIYKMLNKIKCDTFKVEGRQEDAEEFLTYLLNSLHDEMVEVMKLADVKPEHTAVNGDHKASNGLAQSDDDEWQLIGPKNKGCVTRSAEFSETPISQIFLGQMRSALHKPGAQPTATLQPFFSLQLDIQSTGIRCLYDALLALVSRESLVGFTCQKTRQEVDAWRLTTLEDLPAVLILHIKRFVYDRQGGSQKLMKKVDFPIDLELSKELLSQNTKLKYKASQRKYKLFAVIYHSGKEATKGHYITDAYHAGYKCWLRYDDSLVKTIHESALLSSEPPLVPYILFYRRGDTMVGPQHSARAHDCQ